MQDGVDHFKSLIDLLSDFGASQYNFATNKDKEDDLRLDHAVDQTREQLGLVRAEVVMARSETLQANGELDVATTDDVLDLEVAELRIEAKLLYDTSVLARGKLRVVLRLGTGHNHLARGKDKSCGLRLANTHDDGGETLKSVS